MSATSGRNTRTVLTLAAVIIVIYGLQMAKALLVPFLIAVFLALITVRPMLYMQSKRVPAVLAALVIVTVIMLILSLLGTVVGRSIAEFTAAIPSYQARLNDIVADILNFAVEHLNADPSIRDLNDIVNPGFAMGLVATLLNGLRSVLTNVFLIFFTMVFILLEASTVKTKFEASFGPSAAAFERPRAFLVNLGRYLGIKTLVSFATGFLAWLLTWAIGLDFPLLWGMLAFLLNYVPTIGSIIAAVPPVLLAVLQLGPGEALAILTGYVAINILFGNLIEPRVMG
ncbi:MAG: AI-2E family transporter, partial [Woeseiaceae bacterium]|nr:AI-2E family transporter [Woeseiaceae bacterium]